MLAPCVAITGAARGSEGNAPPLPPELAEVRAALQKYEDPIRALQDGYRSTVLCAYSAEGGMGIHFAHPGITGPTPDPFRPNILLYEPEGDRLRLVGAEWLIPLASGVRERPSLFGRPFDGPMEGHPPLQPRGFHHYDLHVWLFKPNPTGVFSVWNPDVTCAGRTPYAHLAEPSVIVPHHR